MFEDIKVGDLVLTPDRIRHAWKAAYFLTRSKVIKVTPKRFTVEEGKTFRKDNGKVVGEGFSFDKAEVYDKDLDQIEERDKYVSRLDLASRISALAASVVHLAWDEMLKRPDIVNSALEQILEEYINWGEDKNEEIDKD